MSRESLKNKKELQSGTLRAREVYSTRLEASLPRERSFKSELTESEKDAAKPSETKRSSGAGGRIAGSIADGIVKMSEDSTPFFWKAAGAFLFLASPLLFEYGFDALNIADPVFSFGFGDVALPLGPTWSAALIWLLMLKGEAESLIPTAKRQVEAFLSSEKRKEQEHIKKLISEGKIEPGDPEYDPELDDSRDKVGFRGGYRQFRAIFRILRHPVSLVAIGSSASLIALGFMTGVITLPTFIQASMGFIGPWLTTLGIASLPAIPMAGAGLLAWWFIHSTGVHEGRQKKKTTVD